MASPGIESLQHRLEVRAELGFAVRHGKTRLTRSFAEPPLQAQRALYLDESVPDMAFVYLLNPTPGIFQGDRHHIRVCAGPDTRVHLTTPSATKIYAMPDRGARQTLELSLREKAYLEYLPHPLIPFRDSRLKQRTQVSLASGATLVMGEMLLPGRVAKGESFAFHCLDRQLTVTGPEGAPIVRQASCLSPHKTSPIGMGLLSVDYPVSASLLVVVPEGDTALLKERVQAMCPGVSNDARTSMIGVSDLPCNSGFSVQLLCRESQFARAILKAATEIARGFFLRQVI